ncbi:MAG: GNAT family N-acetyltransferase [Trebonia sp.]|jgi:aminoglycoside 6'-N-acetyltransferase
MSLPAVTFRPCTPDDLPLLARWMAQPHVARYWREDAELAAVEERYLPCLDGRDPTELFALEADGAPVGLFQRYLVADNEEWATTLRGTGQPDTDTAIGIDYLIGEQPLTGRGLGTFAITAFTQLALERYPAANLLLVDVAQGNIASWRALEKTGYVRCWAGELVSDDPSDEGPMYLYRFTSGR